QPRPERDTRRREDADRGRAASRGADLHLGSRLGRVPRLVPAPFLVREAPAQSFAAISAALTGFRVAELWGTGQVEPYLAEVLATVRDGDDTRLPRNGY